MSKRIYLNQREIEILLMATLKYDNDDIHTLINLRDKLFRYLDKLRGVKWKIKK